MGLDSEPLSTVSNVYVRVMISTSISKPFSCSAGYLYVYLPSTVDDDETILVGNIPVS